jgi:hypothetical protein
LHEDDIVGFWLNTPANAGSSSPGDFNPVQGLSQTALDYYQTNIVPLQQQLLQQAMDPATITREVATAKSDVAQQFANAPAAFQRQAAGMGIDLTSAQRTDFGKRAALNAGIATAQAANLTRQAAGARQAQVVGY